MGTLYIVARAKVELACDSIHAQGHSVNTKIGMCNHQVNDATEDVHQIAQPLLAEVDGQWSTLIMRTTPLLPKDLLTQMHPRHRAMMSTKPHRAGCHV